MQSDISSDIRAILLLTWGARKKMRPSRGCVRAHVGYLPGLPGCFRRNLKMGWLDVQAENYSVVNYTISPDNCNKGKLGYSVIKARVAFIWVGTDNWRMEENSLLATMPKWLCLMVYGGVVVAVLTEFISVAYSWQNEWIHSIVRLVTHLRSYTT